MNDDANRIPDNFVLVLSVGGSPEPLIESIKHYKPGHVIFVASRDSNAKVAEILKRTEGIGRHETITLSDYQNLLACVRDIRDELPKKLEAMNLPSDTLLIADITGGTKVMSAALTLVMMEFNSRFTYVGGSQRTKTGLGIVESGHETIIQMDNPWDAMGLREARSLVQSFNAGQFDAAREKAIFLKSRDSEYSAFYAALAVLIEAFGNWDIFNYKKARTLFKDSLGRLDSYNNRRHNNFRPLYGELKRSFAALEQAAGDAEVLKKPFEPLEAGTGAAYLRDLVANASRCAKGGHYDDAVARLYSAIEKTAKIALAQMGINNSQVQKDVLAAAGGDLANKHVCADKEIKLPLTDSFLLLRGLAPENPVAIAYEKYAAELDKTLKSRNMSLLAHGYNPVSAKDYQKLHAVALQFLDIGEEDLVDFPEMDINSIIF